MTPAEAAAAYAPELIHACGEGIEKRKPLNDPFCYQLGFLDGHGFAMSSAEVQNLILALKKMKCAMWSENVDEQNDAYEFSIGALADMIAKQPGE